MEKNEKTTDQVMRGIILLLGLFLLFNGQNIMLNTGSENGF